MSTFDRLCPGRIPALAPEMRVGCDDAAMGEQRSTAPGATDGAAYKGTRPGGRSARVREAVLAAAAQELADAGYAGLTLTRVAERAGVAATTVTRRWGTRDRLVADMFDGLAGNAAPDPQQPTLTDDLRVLAHDVSTALANPTLQQLLRCVLALPAAELTPIQRRYWASRVALANAIIDRAVRRGEVPAGTPGWPILERVLAPIWMRRLVTGWPVDDAFLDLTVADAVAAATGDRR